MGGFDEMTGGGLPRARGLFLPRPDISRFLKFCCDNGQVMGNKMELPFRQLSISAQKALPGIEALHVAWKKCNASVVCNTLSTQIHSLDDTNPAVCIHLSVCLLYRENSYFNDLDHHVESFFT
jgi:hypothetical protein